VKDAFSSEALTLLGLIADGLSSSNGSDGLLFQPSSFPL
jgi:hypothetical protein